MFENKTDYKYSFKEINL